jgi:O-acetyl-ADP-ribose deacetylase (regulator of RNase III)
LSAPKRQTYQVGASTLSLEFGDITASKADVLVSSDDSYLTMGGGVSAAIRRAAGQGIILEAAKNVPANLGDVIVTGAGLLPAKHVFHAITIGDGKGTAGDVIAGTTRHSLNLLKALGLSSIAFPAIGAGLAGFSLEDVATTMTEVIVETLQDSAKPLSVTIYLFDRFGYMQPKEYVQFFEQVAARTPGLSPTRTKRVATRPIRFRRLRGSKQKVAAATMRIEVLAELAALDRERQTLEGRLAQLGGVLARAEVRKLEAQLKPIQAKRIALLAATKPKPSGPVSVFVSYSHADEKLRRELGDHLKTLEHQGIIASWHDRMIGAGSEWQGVICKHLNDARVILLLISSKFTASHYCLDVEMKRALERHDRREALVIPVILKPVSLKGMPFERLQPLPKDAKPVTKWSDRNSAFVDITEGLQDAIQDLVGAA